MRKSGNFSSAVNTAGTQINISWNLFFFLQRFLTTRATENFGFELCGTFPLLTFNSWNFFFRSAIENFFSDKIEWKFSMFFKLENSSLEGQTGRFCAGVGKRWRENGKAFRKRFRVLHNFEVWKEFENGKMLMTVAGKIKF